MSHSPAHITAPLTHAGGLLAAVLAADAALARPDADGMARAAAGLEAYPGSAIAAVLAAALHAQHGAGRGEHEGAHKGFMAVVQSPFPLPGALAAAQRYFIGCGDLIWSLACLGRQHAPDLRADETAAALHQHLGTACWELWRPVLQASSYAPYMLHALKQHMQARHGLHDAVVAHALLLGSGRTDDLEFRPLTSLQEYARTHGRAFRELVAAGLKEVSSSVVVDQPRLPPYRVHGRSVFHCALADATITAGSSGVEAGGYLLFDYQPGELEDLTVDFRFDVPIVSVEDGTAALVRLNERVMEIERGISLVGATSGAFGHWLMEYLPKYFGLERDGVPADIPVIIDAAMPPAHRQALEFFTQGRREIIELMPRHQMRVRELWVASTYCYVPVMPNAGQEFTVERLNFEAQAVAALVDSFTLPAPVPGATPPKVYLARRPALARKLLNREAVEALCRIHGFELVYLENLSFVEQLALIRNASHIVAPAGSALLLPFCYGAAGTRILNLHPPFLDETPGLTDLAHARGIEVWVVLGDSPALDPAYRGRSDFSVPLDQVQQVLDGWDRDAHRA